MGCRGRHRTLSGMDESVTERLINADLSAMDGVEMRAHLDAVEQHMKQLQRAELTLLEDSSELIGQHPQLQDRLAYLRTLDLDEVEHPSSAEVSGPGS